MRVGGRHVADIGHRNRNDPAGGRARRKPRDRQLRQRRDHAAERHQHRGQRAHERNRSILAEPVGDRPDDELDRAVRHRIGRHHDRGLADGSLEIVGDLRQQRIRHPHHRLGGKACAGKQDDRAERELGGSWRRRSGHGQSRVIAPERMQRTRAAIAPAFGSNCASQAIRSFGMRFAGSLTQAAQTCLRCSAPE